MRTVTFQNVLQGVTRMLGYDPARDLTAPRAGTLCEYINQRIIEGWKFDYWPEWTVTDQRRYRPVYSATEAVTNSPVTERYFYPAGNYYQALQASTGQLPATNTTGPYLENGAYWAVSGAQYFAPPWLPGTSYGVNNDGSGLPYQVQNPNDGNFYQCILAHTSGPAFDPTKFGILTPLDKYVAYEQTGQNPIGEARLASRRDPRVKTNNPAFLQFQPSNNGIQFDWRAPNIVWLNYRLRPPQFTTTLYNSTVAYTAGQSIYDSNGTGNCWTAAANTTAGQNPTSNPSLWTLIPMPAILANFVKRAALSDALRDQKQTDRADDELSNAYVELQDVQDREMAGQGQFESASVQAYGGGPRVAHDNWVTLTGSRTS